MPNPPSLLGKDYYKGSAWDENAWVEIIGVEYETLVSAFDFNAAFSDLAQGGKLRLLDVGCGTAIFPRFLDAHLADGLNLQCDLLDISTASIQQAARVLEGLQHFETADQYEMAIEDIPEHLPIQKPYDVIWAIHSFTTVDRARMPKVFADLRARLKPGGALMVYQLTAESSYQALHKFFANQRPKIPFEPYMQFEESERILKSLDWSYEVIELKFTHRIPEDDRDKLVGYLRKGMLDDAFEPLDIFRPLLNEYLSEGEYQFPQSVNLIIAKK